MKKQLLILFCIIYASSLFAFSGKTSKIILVDGSTIYGKVISIENGKYKIQSDTLGTVSLDESKIQSFNFSSSEKKRISAETQTAPAQLMKRPEVKSIQEKILQNDQILEMILALQNDPTVQSIINNPHLKKAIDTGDINALLNSTEFLKLMDNSTVKKIQDKVTAK